MFKNLGVAAVCLSLCSCNDFKAPQQKKDAPNKERHEEEVRTLSKEFRHKLIDKKGNKILKDIFEDREQVLLVWGADWHPVSKKFLPEFSKSYKTLKELGFEVVYVSNARSYTDFANYVRRMPWPIIDYKFRDKIRVVMENNPMDVPYIAVINKECVATLVGKGDAVMRNLKLEYPELNR